MKQVVVIGASCQEQDIQDKINEELKKWSPEDTEIEFKMCMNEDEVLYSALIIIKDCR